MSYQALARKWRPRRFEDLVGQGHVVRALEHALSEQRLHHALLFSGTRGVGKTTLARIIAKCLNCERTPTTTATPCTGEDACDACREIDEGRFVDLIEVDAASRTGVEDMRELMDNVRYAPTRGRTKVYLIDEVHMLSRHSFNALLKTLEEPPPSVQFLFATTEPEKLPITILSRCLNFPLKRLSVPAISGQIEHVLAAESLTSQAEAIDDIARAADGSMRDALSLLDQAIAFGGGELTAQTTRDMLGTVGQSHIVTLTEAVVRHEPRQALEALENAYMQGTAMRHLLETLATTWQDIATAQLLDDSDSEWHELARASQPEAIQLYYDIALSGLRDFAHAPDPLVGTRMTILRMLAFAPNGREAVTAGTDATAAHVGPTTRQEPDESAGSTVRPGRTPAAVEQGAASPPGTVSAATDKPAAQTAKTADNGRQESVHDGVAFAPEDWPTLVQRMSLSGFAAQLARHCVCRKIDDKHVMLELPRAHEHLNTDGSHGKLQEAVKRLWQTDVAPALRIAVVDQVSDSPAQQDAQAADNRQHEAEQSIQNDPTVKQLQEGLGARLHTDTIKPNEIDMSKDT